jgi:hypothetical protein
MLNTKVILIFMHREKKADKNVSAKCTFSSFKCIPTVLPDPLFLIKNSIKWLKYSLFQSLSEYPSSYLGIISVILRNQCFGSVRS